MSDPAPLTFVIDADPAARRVTGRILEESDLKVEEFDSAEEFLDRPFPGEPACVVLEVDLPGLGGLELQSTLAERAPAVRVVFATASRDAAAAVRALKAGAVDYLFKPVGEGDLLTAVRRAIGRSAEAGRATTDLVEIRRRVAALSDREREVMESVVRGRLNKHIAESLGLTIGTVKVHRGRVMRKMGARSLADLVRMAGRLAAHQGG
jgi:FixJ family two-component response regulator